MRPRTWSVFEGSTPARFSGLRSAGPATPAYVWTSARALVNNAGQVNFGMRLTAVLLACCLFGSVGAVAAQQARGAAAPAAQRPPAAPAAQGELDRAADALLALKSTRFALEREGTPAVLDEATGITFTAADCSYAAPDRASCNIKVALKNGTILQLTRVWVPEGAFQSNPLTRQFAKLPAADGFNGSVLFARNGIPQILRTGVQRPQIVGKVRLQTRDTIHITGDVSGKTLNPLMDAFSPDATYPVQFWIEEKTAHLVQLHVADPPNNGWKIQLSGVNEPITIPTPQVPPPAGKP